MRIACSALLLVAVTACERPHALLVCHNSNCAEPTDPANDDSLAALAESLALEVGGKPAIDGTEIDLFWRGSDDTCIFAHDIEADPARTELASEAAAAVATHLATAPALTYGGGRFQMFVELKDFVDAGKTRHHTPEQRRRHATCAWEVYNTIAQAALDRGIAIDFFFGSFGPEMLKEVIRQTPANVPFPPRYEAYYGVPRPLDSETRPLGDYAGVPITLVEMHSQWITDDAYEALLAADIDVGFFMFSATVEHFAAIEQYEPLIVNTNEALLMRRWLER